MLVAAPTADAYVAGNYDPVQLRTAAGTLLNECRGWGGDADDAGRLYSVCLLLRDTDGDNVGDTAAPGLVEYDEDGIVNQIGWLPAAYYFGQNGPRNYVALDATVTPDGMTAYVTPGPNIDNFGLQPNRHPFTGQLLPNGVTSGSILRLRRGLDGMWRHDPTFKAGPFLLAGNYWAARRVDVDRAGRLYVSVNAYVFELSPTNGTIVSRFGESVTNGVGGPWIDGIDVAQGLAVARDGNSIYVVEQRHNIVLRYERVGATGWRRDTSLLLGTPSVKGDYCTSNRHFQSPYDVSTDIAGDIYVLDVTCNRIQRFRSNGTFVQTAWQDRTPDTLELSHGMAVNPSGSILLPTAGQVLRRIDRAQPPTGGGCTDVRAPSFVTLEHQARSTSRTARIAVTAVDDCTIAVQWRVTGDRSGTPAWTTTPTQDIALAGWNGVKRLTVELRDGHGRLVARDITMQLALPQAPLVARPIVRLAGTGCSTVDPRSRIAGAAAYRVTDRCAAMAGRVIAVQRSRTSMTIELEVPVASARAIYTNAVGPVRMWVVTDDRSRVIGRPRAGVRMQLTGTIVASRSLDAAYVIPVDRVRAS